MKLSSSTPSVGFCLRNSNILAHTEVTSVKMTPPHLRTYWSTLSALMTLWFIICLKRAEHPDLPYCASGYSLLERMFSVINLENADILYVIHFAQRVIFSRKCGTYFKCKFLCILHRSNIFVIINAGKDILSCGYLQAS